MTVKTKLILKWTFVFSVLMIWTYLVITFSVVGLFDNTEDAAYYIINPENQKSLSLEMQNAIEKKNFNMPIYEETTAGIEKASSEELLDMLFNHNFEIQEKSEYVDDESCSLRAEGGSLKVDNTTITDIKLGFTAPLKNSAPGEGSLTAQKNRDRFSLSFDIEEILETNSERLIFRASGKGRLNQKEIIFDEIIVSFDKINNIVGIIGTGDKDFEASGLKVSSVKGCLSADHNFYLLMDNGELGKGRSAEEVVKILKENHEFLDIY